MAGDTPVAVVSGRRYNLNQLKKLIEWAERNKAAKKAIFDREYKNDWMEDLKKKNQREFKKRKTMCIDGGKGGRGGRGGNGGRGGGGRSNHVSEAQENGISSFLGGRGLLGEYPGANPAFGGPGGMGGGMIANFRGGMKNHIGNRVGPFDCGNRGGYHIGNYGNPRQGNGNGRWEGRGGGRGGREWRGRGGKVTESHNGPSQGHGWPWE